MNISRVKKNKPTFQGRFCHLPPILSLAKTISAEAQVPPPIGNLEGEKDG